MPELKIICKVLVPAAAAFALNISISSRLPCLSQGFGPAPSPPPLPTVVPLVPTDVTNLPLIKGLPLGPPDLPDLSVTSAIKRIPEWQFPIIDPLPGSGAGGKSGRNNDATGVIFETCRGSKFEQNDNGALQLSSGKVFVSVRKPSRLALIVTPHASVSISGDGDAIISFEDGLLRVLNLSALGERVKVDIHEASVSAKILAAAPGESQARSEKEADGQVSTQASTEASTKGIALAIKVGHELLASDHPLKRADLNPSDGVARRRAALFENDYMCVSEFSLDSVLNNCDFVCQLEKNPRGKNEHKVLAQLAKMAAVLNYVNGEGGFVSAGKQR